MQDALGEQVALLDGPLLAIANRNVPALSVADTVFDAARLMAAYRLSCVPVLDAQRRPLGVVTEGLLLAAAYGVHGPAQCIERVMQPPSCVPHTIDAAPAFERCLAEGGAPLLLVDAGGCLVAMAGEGEFRAQLQLALRPGRHREQLEERVHRRTAELEAANARLEKEDRRLRAMLELSRRASGLDEQKLLVQGLQTVVEVSGSRAGFAYAVGADDAAPRLQARSGAGGPPPDDLAWRVLQRRRACAARGEALIGVPVLDGGRVALVVCLAGVPVCDDEADLRAVQLMAADLWAIVQRRRIEIELGQAKAAADAASLAKSAFLANMSHEIRTPMNAVIGFAHLLRREPLSPRQNDHLDKIIDAGQHLLEVISDILDFSKIEAHKVTLAPTDFALRDCAERVLSLQADAARARGLSLALSLDAGCPPLIHGDRLRLEQVLLNLLSNAVKFTLRGSIDLRVGVRAGGDAPSWLRFEVGDTGIGLSEDQQAHVFEAFAQADASTTRRFGGTGLGLAISKRLVELMGGHIGVRSQPGVGSLFWVEVPLTPVQACAAPAAPTVESRPDAARLLGARVLVVEDNPINLELTAALLASLGVAADQADGGEAALRAFDPRRHELVLMDLQMPGIDGFAATAALRARPDAASVPIVAMTASAFADNRARCLECGMNDFLSKPVEAQALEACLLRWLKGSQPAAAAAGEPGDGGSDAALRLRLEGVPGLDVHGPLGRVRGSWPLYLRMLRLFASHHADDPDRLRLAAGDAQALRALAHALAGAAASVGATEIHRQAQALQSRVAAGGDLPSDVWQPLADTLRRCLQQLADALRVEEDRPAAAVGVDRAEVRAALGELQRLVVAHDTAALGLFERRRGLFEAGLGPAVRQLAHHLGEFSFGAAQTVVSAELRRLADADGELPPE